MGIQSMTDCMFPADTRRQNFVFHSPWLLQDASQLTRISAWAFVAALHDDTWSLVTSSLSPPPLTFHPLVPVPASWLLFHLKALLHLSRPCLPCSFHSPQLQTSAFSPTSHKTCILLPAGTSRGDKLLSSPLCCSRTSSSLSEPLPSVHFS